MKHEAKKWRPPTKKTSESKAEYIDRLYCEKAVLVKYASSAANSYKPVIRRRIRKVQAAINEAEGR